tara:strand:+ start:3327 stop:3557 length:231 start_codon:yes stop_codon:yes gene_type:complete
MENLKLTDNAISHVAQLLQIAILTGTDIVDNLRSAQFVLNDGEIEISPDYYENFNENLQKMLSEAETALQENSADE